MCNACLFEQNRIRLIAHNLLQFHNQVETENVVFENVFKLASGATSTASSTNGEGVASPGGLIVGGPSIRARTRGSGM